jgi:hypothetical protein
VSSIGRIVCPACNTFRTLPFTRVNAVGCAIAFEEHLRRCDPTHPAYPMAVQMLTEMLTSAATRLIDDGHVDEDDRLLLEGLPGADLTVRQEDLPAARLLP